MCPPRPTLNSAGPAGRPVSDNAHGPAVVFFDVGGTLLYFNVEPSALYSRIVKDHGAQIPPDALYRSMREVESEQPVPLGLTVQSEAEYWRAYNVQILRRLGVDPTPALLDEVDRRFREELRLQPYAESLEVLEAVRDRGIRLGVISNASHGILGDLERAGMTGFFEHIVYSQAVGVAKPDPRIFHEALQRFAVAPGDTWHIGDNVVADIEGARGVGIRPVLVRRRSEEPPEGVATVEDLRGVLDLLQGG